MAFKIAGNIRLKALYHDLLRPLDGVLGLTDPLADATGRARRSRSIMKAGIPSYLLQHGVLQEGWNRFQTRQPKPFYSDLVFAFEPLVELEGRIPDAELAKIRTVGFVSIPLLAQRAPPAAFMEWRKQFGQIILLCHSFRWQSRFTETDIAEFYEMARSAAVTHPDVGFIIRPHRGLSSASHDDFDEALAAQNKNVVISLNDSGPLSGLSMFDVLREADAVVSPASTAILDAVYADKRTAVYRNDSAKFPELRNIITLEDLSEFIDAIERPDIQLEAVQRRYGAIESNIARCCAFLEDHMAVSA